MHDAPKRTLAHFYTSRFIRVVNFVSVSPFKLNERSDKKWCFSTFYEFIISYNLTKKYCKCQ